MSYPAPQPQPQPYAANNPAQPDDLGSIDYYTVNNSPVPNRSAPVTSPLVPTPILPAVPLQPQPQQPGTPAAMNQPQPTTNQSTAPTVSPLVPAPILPAAPQPQQPTAPVGQPLAQNGAQAAGTPAAQPATTTTTTTTTTAGSPTSNGQPPAQQPASEGEKKHVKHNNKNANANTPIVEHGNQYQMAVIGGGSVGKSCLTIQFVKHFFVNEYDPTIEDSYRSQVVIDGSVCILNIMDTAGQDLYSAMRDHYYRSGEGFLLVYSVTTRVGFDDLDQLRSQILRVKEEELINDRVPIVLVANKIDLASDRVISTFEGQEKAKLWGCPYVETSAKQRINVDEVFFTLVREIRRYFILAQEKDRPAPPPRMNIFKRFGCVLL